MANLHIVCIDDQRDVLATLQKELHLFTDYFMIHFCESAQEASEIIDYVDQKGESLALLICDHVMPGKSGVDFLTEINKDIRFPNTKKLLLTGLATQDDTVEAINKANIDRYIGKPWDTNELIQMVKVLLTEFIFDTGIDHSNYLFILDQETLYRKLRQTPQE